MRRYLVSINNRELEVELVSRSGSEVAFSVEGERYQVSIAPVLQQIAPTSPSVASGAVPQPPRISRSQPGEVVAPMPGIVVSLPVKEGEAVQLGQTVAVIEAMKMENNIAATRSGLVKKIHVKPGSEVGNAAVLLEIAEEGKG